MNPEQEALVERPTTLRHVVRELAGDLWSWDLVGAILAGGAVAVGWATEGIGEATRTALSGDLLAVVASLLGFVAGAFGLAAGFASGQLRHAFNDIGDGGGAYSVMKSAVSHFLFTIFLLAATTLLLIAYRALIQTEVPLPQGFRTWWNGAGIVAACGLSVWSILSVVRLSQQIAKLALLAPAVDKFRSETSQVGGDDAPGRPSADA